MWGMSAADTATLAFWVSVLAALAALAAAVFAWWQAATAHSTRKAEEWVEFELRPEHEVDSESSGEEFVWVWRWTLANVGRETALRPTIEAKFGHGVSPDVLYGHIAAPLSGGGSAAHVVPRSGSKWHEPDARFEDGGGIWDTATIRVDYGVPGSKKRRTALARVVWPSWLSR